MTITSPLFPTLQNPEPEEVLRIVETLPFLHNEHNYIILDLSEDTLCFFQGRPVAAGNGAFHLEYRDGHAKRQFMCWVDSVEEARPLFLSYLAQDQQWQDMVWWRDVSHCVRDLREEGIGLDIPFESDFFTEQEWQQRQALREQKVNEWYALADELDAHPNSFLSNER